MLNVQLDVVRGDPAFAELDEDGRPIECPRRAGELGPRECEFYNECRFHNLYQARQKQSPNVLADERRLTAALELGDDCSLEVAERTDAAMNRRARRTGLMSYTAIGVRLGLSKRQVSRIADRALRNFAASLGITIERGTIARLSRRMARR